MAIYSSGYAAVFGVFALMYHHAYVRRSDLGLTAKQAFETRAQGGAMALHLGFGLASVLIALVLPGNLVSVAGLMYFLIGPAQWLYWSRVRRRRTR